MKNVRDINSSNTVENLSWEQLQDMVTIGELNILHYVEGVWEVTTSNFSLWIDGDYINLHYITDGKVHTSGYILSGTNPTTTGNDNPKHDQVGVRLPYVGANWYFR